MSEWLSTSHQRARKSAGPDRLPPRLGRTPPASDPEPPPPPPGRMLQVLARVLLWTLIGLAVLHGLLPTWAAPGRSRSTGAAHSSSGRGGSRSQASAQSQLAMAMAAAFLREYLTVDAAQSDRPGGSGATSRGGSAWTAGSMLSRVSRSPRIWSCRPEYGPSSAAWR
jgi:hypothetical protein